MDSLNVSIEMLTEGFGWKIGNGRFMNFKEHRWGFEGLCGKSLILENIDESLSFMRDLWKKDEYA